MHNNANSKDNNLRLTWLNIVVIILFSLSWLVPHHFSPWKSALQDFLAITTLVVLLSSLPIKQYRLPKLILSPALLMLVIPFQSLLGTLSYSSDAWLGFLYIALFALALTYGFQLQQSNFSHIILLFQSTLLFAAFISALIALRQWLGVDLTSFELSHINRPYANMAQPNSLSTLIMLGTVSALTLFAQRKLPTLTFVLIIFILAFSLILTKSRTPLLACLIISFFLIGRRKYYLPFALFISFLMLSYLLEPILNSVLLLSDSISIIDRAKAMERTLLYKQFALAILQKPWFGYGVNQVAMAQLDITPVFSLPKMMAQHTHNIVLDMMVWFGIPITVLTLGYMLLKTKFWPSIKNTETQLYAQLSAVAILTHGMLEFPLEYAIFLIPFGIFVGLIAQPANSISISSVKIKIFMTILVLPSLFTFYEYIQLEQFYQAKRIELIYPEMPAQQPTQQFIFTDSLYSLATLTNRKPTGSIQEHKRVAYRYPSELNLKNYYEVLLNSGLNEQASHVLIIIKGVYGSDSAEKVEAAVLH